MRSTTRLLLFCVLGEVGFTDGNIRITPFFFGASSEIIVPAVYGAGSAGTLHEIVPVLGFDFVATDIAADCIFDNQLYSSFVSSEHNRNPIRTPSMNPDF